jgi:diguanylate cyclase (GGDEF)-like protein
MAFPLKKRSDYTMQNNSPKLNSLFAPKITTKKVIITYLLLSILLFVFLDKIIFSLSIDITTLFILQNTKNYLFLLLSSIVLYFLLNLYTKALLIVSEELKLLQITHNQVSTQKQAFLSAMPDALFHLDKQGILLDFVIPENINLPPKFTFTQAALGKHISEFFSPGTTEKNLAVIQKVLTDHEIQCLEYHYQDKNEITHWEARYVPYPGEEVLLLVRNITTQQQSIEKLKQLSIHDKLTGLTNRTYFELQLERLQDAQHFPVGVVVCNVEYLKLLNETLGRVSSDKALLKSVNLIKSSFTGTVSISRIGSNQFVVFYKNTALQHLQSAAQALRENEAAYNKDNPDFPLSISLGLAISENQESKIHEVFCQAEYAMYCDEIDRSKDAHELFLQAILLAFRKHDTTAHDHFVHMQQLIEKFAGACNLSAQTIQELKWLATFHDIGKIGVPSYILEKQDRLTPEELIEVQKHSSIGYKIARVTPSLMPIADLINKHHEWWNGQGYPLGLKEEQIPLECRIIAIVEAFDAMISDHPYRAAMPVSAALQEIQKCAGTQFDPDLAEKFLELMQKEVSD